jgi:pyrimidine operon attenuation protein / uracil phosphoribosyltransferase
MNTVLNESQLEESIFSLTNQIALTLTKDTILLGIDLKGKILAKRIADKLTKLKSISPKVGQLEVSLYKPIEETSYMNIGQSEITFSLKNKTVILVTPFIITGKTILAALVALNDYDVPNSIECCCILSSQNLKRPILTKYIATTKIKAKKTFTINFYESDGEDIIIENILKIV